MELRKVDIDFSDAKVHWSRNEPEYSQLLNAISSLIPGLETLLIKAVRDAQSRLPETAAALRRDAEIFAGQEARHTKMHRRFNNLLENSGYGWLKAAETKINADFRRFIEVKGPKFALAYSDGFETFGPIVASFFFERSGALMKDLDEPTVYLWLWHFAEEYEHRTVCNSLYREIYGGYWYRIFALWFATIHLFGYSVRVARKLIATDRKTGHITDPLRSRIRFGRVLVRFFSYVLPRLVFDCMRPGYDPGRIPPPGNAMRFLEEVSRRYGIVTAQ